MSMEVADSERKAGTLGEVRSETGTVLHVSVCVCTFQRPALLAELIRSVLLQQTDGQITFSVVVVDNDRAESGRETVESFQRTHPGGINYVVEPEQNIALARNKSVQHARGDLVAFVDDDEVPNADWLLQSYRALIKYGVAGVLGPVRPRFAEPPPKWVVKARIFERTEYETGYKVDWRQTGTGNVLIWRRFLDQVEGPFHGKFGSGGEDLDFFRRSMELGNVYVWCNEAVIYEIVPAVRTRAKFQLRRALLRGRASLGHPSSRGAGIFKSIMACALYTLLLPVFLLMGYHVFMKYLIKNFDHAGKLLALCKVHLVREKYVTK